MKLKTFHSCFVPICLTEVVFLVPAYNSTKNMRKKPFILVTEYLSVVS